MVQVSKVLKSHFEVAYVVSGTRFRAPRARSVRKVEFFFMDQFLLLRRFQRGITHPWERSGSMFAVKLCATENAFKTYQSENRFIVLLYSVVPSLAPERQLNKNNKKLTAIAEIL